MGPEFDGDTFDAGSGKKIKGYFSTVGFAVLLMLTVCTAVQFLAVYVTRELMPELINENWYVWALSVAPTYLIGLPVFLAVMRRVPSLPPEKTKLKVGEFAVFIIMSFGMVYVGNIIGNWLMNIVMNISGKEIPNAASDLLMESNPVIAVLVTAIAAPLVEELIFRKTIIDKTRAYGEKTAILLSALLFALYHGNLYQSFYAFAVGLILAYVYVRTGKFIYPVLIHMTINTVSGVIASYVLRILDVEKLNEFISKITDNSYLQKILSDEEALEEYKNSMTELLPTILPYFIYSLAIMVLSIAGIVLLITRIKRIKFVPSEFEIPSDRIGNTVYFNAGVMMAIFGLLAVTVVNLFQ